MTKPDQTTDQPEETTASSVEKHDNPPIGRVLILQGHGIATLLGRDTWEVVIDGERDAKWEEFLADHYRDTYAGPQDGAYGAWILNDLAKMFGTMADITIEPMPYGTVA